MLQRTYSVASNASATTVVDGAEQEGDFEREVTPQVLQRTYSVASNASTTSAASQTTLKDFLRETTAEVELYRWFDAQRAALDEEQCKRPPIISRGGTLQYKAGLKRFCEEMGTDSDSQSYSQNVGRSPSPHSQREQSLEPTEDPSAYSQADLQSIFPDGSFQSEYFERPPELGSDYLPSDSVPAIPQDWPADSDAVEYIRNNSWREGSAELPENWWESGYDNIYRTDFPAHPSTALARAGSWSTYLPPEPARPQVKVQRMPSALSISTSASVEASEAASGSTSSSVRAPPTNVPSCARRSERLSMKPRPSYK